MIRLASVQDAHLVHKVMITAYEEYRYADVPSGALNETVSSIAEALNQGVEQALLYYLDDVPVGTVRFTVENNSLYFFRLSVVPEARNRGIAKSMLSWLENYAKEHGLTEIWCKVRMTIPINVRLYESIGYVLTEQKMVTNSGLPINVGTMKKILIQLH